MAVMGKEEENAECKMVKYKHLTWGGGGLHVGILAKRFVALRPWEREEFLDQTTVKAPV
jgi:hypothetical protein